MATLNRGAYLGLAFMLVCMAVAAPAQTRREFKFSAGPGTSLNIHNEAGPITVRAGAGPQIVVVTTMRSDTIEIDQAQSGARVELRTHFLQQRPSGDGARVDYDVTVPPECAVTLRSSTGPITVEHLRGDVNAEGDAAKIDIRDTRDGHVHVRTMSGTVSLANITNGHVEVTSIGGPVSLSDVSGPRVEVNTTTGKVTYTGAFAGSGDYVFATHNGDIDISLPGSASVDLAARSLRGSVENEFPFQPKAHTAGDQPQGRAFSGTANQGSASVQLRSFSGKIRVKKQ